MKITREVIYDLLPAYFAGEVSADTRALIDEFLTTDPEFARMTERFHKLLEERASKLGVITPERERLERARQRAEARQISGAFTVAFGLAALFPHVRDYLTGHPFPGTPFLSLVFGIIAFGSAIGWFIARNRSV
jgi:anti-sigma factor RsiW